METSTPFAVLNEDLDLLMEYLRTVPPELHYGHHIAAGLELQRQSATVLGRRDFPPDVVRLGSDVLLRNIMLRQNDRYTLVLQSGERKDGQLPVRSQRGLKTWVSPGRYHHH